METKNMKSTKLKNGNLIMQSMKKIIYCIFIALIAISCNPPAPPLVIPMTLGAQTPLPDHNPDRNRSAWEDQAESWDDYDMDNTRTYAVIDPNDPSEYFQYWSADDKISVFFTTANLQYSLGSYKDDLLDYGIFELVGNKTEGTEFTTDYYYSVYPYKENTKINKNGRVTYTFPQTQHYNGDSYANGENGMIAIEPKDTDEILYFQNFCSYLQLRLVANEGESKTVKKITLIANNIDDKMEGECSIEIQNENSTPTVKMKNSATNQLTLDCGTGVELSQDESNPTKFWFVLPGSFTFTEGFNVTVTFKDNTVFKKSTSKQITIERNHIKPMVTFKPESKPAIGAIRYKYNDPSINEPFPLGNTFFDENGQKLDIIDQVYNSETGEWTVLLSGTLKTIGDNSFDNHELDLEYIKIDNNDEVPITVNNFAFYNCTADFIEIYNDVDAINGDAFSGCSTQELKIEGNVTTITHNAGTGSNIEHINITGKVETIEDHAFSGCINLKTINITNVGTIEDQAFMNCINLQSISIPNIETIEYQAFMGCTNLKEANIAGVKHLQEGAFRNCKNLTTITLDSVITIDDNVFMDCRSLTTAVISEKCIMIGEGAFCNATSLKTVYCYAVYPPFIKTDNKDSSYVFDKTDANICIYIPMGSLDYYIDDTYFEEHPYEGTTINAKVNWWYEEYEYILEEM